MKESLALEFRLTGQRGALSSKPYFLAIGVLKDREPRVTIRSSGVGRRVTPVARIPLAHSGQRRLWRRLAGARLGTHRDAATTSRRSTPSTSASRSRPPRRRHAAATEINLRPRSRTATSRASRPGNTLKLRGAATDACAPAPRPAFRRWLSFQIVAPDELFYEILDAAARAAGQVHRRAGKCQGPGQGLGRAAKERRRLRPSRGPSRSSAARCGKWPTSSTPRSNEMTLNDLGNPQARENLQTAIITPLAQRCTATCWQRLRGVDRRAGGNRRRFAEDRAWRSDRAGRSVGRDDAGDPGPDVAVGKLHRRDQPTQAGHRSARAGAQDRPKRQRKERTEELFDR